MTERPHLQHEVAVPAEHVTTSLDPEGILTDETYQWLLEHVALRLISWDFVEITDRMALFRFRDARHAVLFKLRWG